MRDMTKAGPHGPIPRLRRSAAAAAGVIVCSCLPPPRSSTPTIFLLKPTRFFVAPNDSVRIDALNGTFTSSEAAVDRERIRELSLRAGRSRPPAG